MKNFLQFTKGKKSGFTLIELLVVISIIGLLASVIIVSLNSAREKARDARRMSDIKEIQKAIELYISDYGNAPDFGDPVCADPQSNNGGCFANDMGSGGHTWVQLEIQLAPYISKLPKDPCGATCYNKQVANNFSDGYFTYRYSAPGEVALYPPGIGLSTDYTIVAQNLESKAASFGFGAGSF